jgi:YesN/AraC family two-component response regulator
MQTFLENAMHDVIKFFRKFDFDIIFSTSNSHRGKDSLPDAYREALDMLAHALKNSTYGLYYYMDVREDHKTTYFYPPEKEQNIVKFLKNGEYEKIEKEFYDIYSKNFDNIFTSLEMVRCLYIDILATILKTCKSGMEGEMYVLTDTTNVMRLILNCTEISLMTNSMLGVFKSCCDEIKMRNCGIEDAFVSDVQMYIQKNYSNINLNVTSIADEFLVHPNYLSKLFKKQMKMNMLTYVNNVRINEAKRLLSGTNYSLEEICKKTGFGSYRTFIRVFHQIVSISPSRYRNLTSHNN